MAMAAKQRIIALLRGHEAKALFGDDWENYAGQSGAVVALGAPGDPPTAEWMSRRSGTTIIWKQGWNTGQGQSASGLQSSERESYSQVGVPLLSPNEMMSLPHGTGIIWLQGMADECVPFAAPNYWQRAEITPLVNESPYHPDGGTAASSAPAAAAPAYRHAGQSSNVAAPGLAIAFAVSCIFALFHAGGGQSNTQQAHVAQPFKNTHFAVHPAR